MNWLTGTRLPSDEAARLDFDYVEAALRTTCRAGDRPRGVIEAAFRNGLGFGLYGQAGGSGRMPRTGRSAATARPASATGCTR
jgi:hypothetical protein